MIKGISFDPRYYDEESSNQVQDALQAIVGEVERDRFTENYGGGVADFLVLGISFLTVGGLTAFINAFMEERGRILAERIYKTVNEEQRQKKILDDFKENYPECEDIWKQGITTIRTVVVRVESLNLTSEIQVHEPANANDLHNKLINFLKDVVNQAILLEEPRHSNQWEIRKFMRQTKVTVLFLAANPLTTTRLRLDEEARLIEKAIQGSELSSLFEVKQCWAAKIDELQGYLLRYSPDIVHFSGHGDSSSEIVIENDDGSPYAIPPESLAKLFSVLKDDIKLVVLNTCYSEQQAQSIVQNIECVVGMSGAVNDRSAMNFSYSFYQALAYGRNIKTAFDLGCLQIDLKKLPSSEVLSLLTRAEHSAELTFDKR
ncbi:MAG: CHAT domain-containing protein [Cyanobacteria bacterium SBLK]|nr:CHAT domain-containing protein [Cyanobacteria bacterium SBLK]